MEAKGGPKLNCVLAYKIDRLTRWLTNARTAAEPETAFYSAGCVTVATIRGSTEAKGTKS